MYSEPTDTSCSDCKMEIIEKRWNLLLLNWLNRCVHPKTPVQELNYKSLLEVINKYKNDICSDEIDRAILNSEDIEPFIKYKYPILRLRYFWEDKDMPKKMFIMTTIMLFHCCVNSIEGVVDSDICVKLDKCEQELILKFCERLSEMEATVNNIECAIKDACDTVKQGPRIYKNHDYEKSSKISNNSEVCEQSVIHSILKPSSNSMTSDSPREHIKKKFNALKFKSSVTVLPSFITDTSSAYSDADFVVQYGSKTDLNRDDNMDEYSIRGEETERTDNERTDNERTDNEGVDSMKEGDYEDQNHRCQPDCACSRCSASGPCCGDPGQSALDCDTDDEDIKKLNEKLENAKPGLHSRQIKYRFNWQVYICLVLTVVIAITIAILSSLPWKHEKIQKKMVKEEEFRQAFIQEPRIFQPNSYICNNGLCQKVFEPTSERVYLSLSRCVLLCTGPQLWPYPIGYTYFSKKLIPLATNKLEYKFQSVPSEAVHLYLAEAFKLFLGDLAKLERFSLENKRENLTRDAMVKKMYIQIDVDQDPDPRLRVDTEESYTVKIETANNVVTIRLYAASFCGIRHSLETLSQLLLLDQKTGFLITLSHVVIKDAPSYRYRGLMLDTGRNYIPLPDIMRTIDAMATCKLNTFHWRISDVTSFPLLIPTVPQLFEYGSYSKKLVYTKDDVKAVVKRAGIRGIRVLLEVAAPGPVGRAWSWLPEATCPTKNRNYTCNNVLCLRLGIQDSVFDVLQVIYSEIIDMTKVDDVFHLSDSVFSLANCYYLIEEREGFLDKALERLKMANKGFLPKLPIIWYTSHLNKDLEAKTWDRFAVQLTEWLPSPSDQYLTRFKVIHSSRWDLSCEVKKQRCRKYRTWQEMYSWKSWRNIEVFTIEGGEAILWTDLVDTGNLDYHLWPRAAAVAERLWSDMALNGSASGPVYVRLDSHRWRMVLKSIQVQPIWPLYCSFSPGICLQQLKNKNK